MCLILPCLVILQKISNHLELLKGGRSPCGSCAAALAMHLTTYILVCYGFVMR